MAKMINFNVEKWDGEFKAVAMDRMEKAANVLADEARNKLIAGHVTRGPYKKGKYAGKIWTSRGIGKYPRLRDTIRAVGKEGNVRVYVGNFKTWYAMQVEYGKGGWKGGAHPFMRPAMKSARGAMRVVLESGAGQTKDY